MDLMEVDSISKIRRVHDQGLMTALVTPTLKVDLDGRPDLSDPISSMPGPSRPQVLGHGNMSMPQATTRIRTGVHQVTVDHTSWTFLATQQKTSFDVLIVVPFTTRVGQINPHVVNGT